MDENNKQYKSDHDLLIELKAEVRSLREAIQSLTNTHQATIKDHEDRLRRLETWGAMAIGALALLQFAFKFIIK